MQFKKVFRISFIIVLTSNLSHSQINNKLVYLYRVSFSLQKYEKVSLGKLYFDNKSSLFVYNKLGDLSTNEKKSAMVLSDTGAVMWSSIKDEKGQQIFRDYSSHKIIIRETGSKLMPPFVVNDDWQPIDWKIDEETKTIDTFLCQKAVGYFRGRTYIAWFTHTVPTTVGPWKLFGLPGLIIEAEDTQHNFSFKLVGQEIDSTPIQKPDESEVKSLEEYVYYLDNYILFVKKRMQETLPQGVSVTLSNPPSKREIRKARNKKIERIFEWEKDKDISPDNKLLLRD